MAGRKVDRSWRPLSRWPPVSTYSLASILAHYSHFRGRETTRILNFRNGGAKTPEGYPGPGSLQECKIVPSKGANIMLAAEQEQLFSWRTCSTSRCVVYYQHWLCLFTNIAWYIPIGRAFLTQGKSRRPSSNMGCLSPVKHWYYIALSRRSGLFNFDL